MSVLPEGPVHVKMGKDITLECVSSGEPRSSPRWTRLGIPVKLEPRMFGLMNSHAMLKVSLVCSVSVSEVFSKSQLKQVSRGGISRWTEKRRKVEVGKGEGRAQKPGMGLQGGQVAE